MKINIQTHTTIQDIKKVFHEHYPGLKLDFFIDKNKDGNYTANEKVTDYNITFSSLGVTKKEGEILIEGKTLVKEVENSFQKAFGVVAQIFRKSGNQWLMTSSSDSQSLEELNTLALESLLPDKGEAPINAQDRMELE
jgi:hypothetical protein